MRAQRRGPWLALGVLTLTLGACDAEAPGAVATLDASAEGGAADGSAGAGSDDATSTDASADMAVSPDATDDATSSDGSANDGEAGPAGLFLCGSSGYPPLYCRTGLDVCVTPSCSSSDNAFCVPYDWNGAACDGASSCDCYWKAAGSLAVGALPSCTRDASGGVTLQCNSPACEPTRVLSGAPCTDEGAVCAFVAPYAWPTTATAVGRCTGGHWTIDVPAGVDGSCLVAFSPTTDAPCTNAGKGCTLENACGGNYAATCAGGYWLPLWASRTCDNCPGSEPVAGASCGATPEGSICLYPNRCNGIDFVTCKAGAFAFTRASCGGAAICPTTPPDSTSVDAPPCSIDSYSACGYRTACGGLDVYSSCSARWTHSPSTCPASSCPATEPLDGMPCATALEGTACTYATSCGHDDVARCSAGIFHVDTPRCTPAGCPTSEPLAGDVCTGSASCSWRTSCGGNDFGTCVAGANGKRAWSIVSMKTCP